MTTSADLRDLAVTALVGKTAAGTRVYTPRTWPSSRPDYPILVVTTPEEQKDSLGRNVPQFTTTATLRITARVEAHGGASDAGSMAVLVELEALKEQIERAVINSYELTRSIQQFSTVQSAMRTNSEGEMHLGELVMHFALEFYQGPEDFYAPETSTLEQLDIRADLVNVADPTGTYADPDFPDSVTPAPRTEGPDGRNEGRVIVNPQG